MKSIQPAAILAAVVVGLLFPADARPQPASGAIVSGTVGVVAIDSNTDLSVSAAAGYRFNRGFGLGIELTSVPSLSSKFPTYMRYLGGQEEDDEGGRVTIFTTNVRLEIPTTTTRVVPYAVFGGGIANVKESVGVVIPIGILTPGMQMELAPQIYPSPEFRDAFLFSTTNMALTAGGGVSFLAGGHMSIDVDLRYFRLLGDKDRDIGRFGAGVSYRF